MRGKRIQIALKQAIIGPPAKRHLMAFCWRADDGLTLNTGLVCLFFFFVFFQWILTSIAKKPYIFGIFQGGGGPDPLHPPPPSGSPHVIRLLINMSTASDSNTLLNEGI